MKTKLLFAGICLFASVPLATAGLVEPDDFPAGTDISQAFPGVTLSTVDSDLGDPHVFALVPTMPYWASTGVIWFLGTPGIMRCTGSRVRSVRSATARCGRISRRRPLR